MSRRSDERFRGAIVMINRKRRYALLRVSAAALAIFAAGGATNLSARVLLWSVHAGLPAAAKPVVDSVCQALFDASDKLYTAPYHLYSTQTSKGIENGKPMSSETISAGGKRYILMNGAWSVSPISIEVEKEMGQRNRKSARNLSCRYLRDEPVNGESAAVYSTHSETEQGKNDNKVWVSKGTGLILRQETDLDLGAGRPKAHVSVRYEYENVQAPRL
jgi:hypothetical protein